MNEACCSENLPLAFGMTATAYPLAAASSSTSFETSAAWWCIASTLVPTRITGFTAVFRTAAASATLAASAPAFEARSTMGKRGTSLSARHVGW